MRRRSFSIVLGALALGTLAMFWAGCTVTVTSTEPTTAPPAAPVVSVTCGPNQYLRGGRHVWRRGRWVWQAPRCVMRTANWRPGCRWTRGHWVRHGRRYVYRQGRLVCPRRVIRPAGPTVLPPAPPVVRITCAPNQYLRGGKYVWRGGRWVWRAPRCIQRTPNWRRGCVWRRGGWKRVGRGLRYFPGRLVCPKVVPLRVIQPTWLPPARPPKTYRRVRCPRGKRYYPGRYIWNNMARQFVWRPGKCIPRRRGCRWMSGRWVIYNGHARYIRPGWRCRGRRIYLTYGGTVWKPGPRYAPILRLRPCGRNRYRAANGRCVRYKRRCPAGFVLRRGRCFKRYVPRRCGRGWVLRGGRCVMRTNVRPMRPCGPGLVRRAGRCVRLAGHPVRCGLGFMPRGGRCVRVPHTGRRCRPGFALRGRRCVKVRRPTLKCRPGFALRGRRCVKVRRPALKCRKGFVRRGRRCVKVLRPALKCRKGFVLRGRRCVKVRRPALKCRKGFVLRGRRCVKVRRPKLKCRRGFVLRGRRCVKRR